MAEQGDHLPGDPFVYFDGEEGRLTDFAGHKQIVVNFFASWCGPCVDEMPEFQEVSQEVGDEVTFLGLAVNDRIEDSRRIVEQTGVTQRGVRYERDAHHGVPGAEHAGDRVRTGRRHRRPGPQRPDERRGAADDHRRGTALVIDAPLALAFGAGMVAAFNPCGFAMLPAYLAFFLGLEDGHAGDDRGAGVLDAVRVSGALTLGFVAVFAVAGALITWTTLSIQQYLPWVTMVIGLALIGLGIAFLVGWQLTVRLPKLEKGGGSRRFTSMFVFGISYAVASLSCTIAPFLAVTSTTFRDQNLVSGTVTFVAYGVGMGLVIAVLTVAVGVAKGGLVGRLRQLLPTIVRVSGCAPAARRRLHDLLRLLTTGKPVEQGEDIGGRPARSRSSISNSDISNRNPGRRRVVGSASSSPA
ncbi:MAG: cytochrome c biogenesis protein CcdA [Acidimicrobiia bacterium]|nr:cytochrome c biogenesis protein CcdA [Acidimicrobiia bacterium]